MMDLTVTYARHNVAGVAGPIRAHPISYYELTIVLRGSVDYRIDGKGVLLQGQDAMLIPKGAVRQRLGSEEDVDYISFNFTTDQPPQLPLVMHGCVRRTLRRLLEAFDQIQGKAYWDNRQKLSHLLACILLVLEDQVRTEQYHPAVLAIMRHIHANYPQRITLAQLGQLTAFSPVYCDSLFRQQVGRSITDYLIDTRISYAKRLLEDGGESVSWVGEQVGFPDSNYFSRVFKKRVGISPGMYRKRYTEG